jgi:putative acetyltransferase
VYSLIKLAFKTAKVSNGTEQDYTQKMRNSDKYIKELELIAIKDEEIIGHIMFTKTTIKGEYKDYETLLIAPLCVPPEHRNKGVGSSLIKQGFAVAIKMGYESVILVGHPSYYSRFGFKQSEYFGIKNTNGIPREFVLACELIPSALKEVCGKVTFATE